MSATDKPKVFDGRWVGEPITIIDSKGIKGPGRVCEADRTGFAINVLFNAHFNGGVQFGLDPEYDWHFYPGETGDFGLTLEFVPFVEPAS